MIRLSVVLAKFLSQTPFSKYATFKYCARLRVGAGGQKEIVALVAISSPDLHNFQRHSCPLDTSPDFVHLCCGINEMLSEGRDTKPSSIWEAMHLDEQSSPDLGAVKLLSDAAAVRALRRQQAHHLNRHHPLYRLILLLQSVDLHLNIQKLRRQIPLQCC